MDLSGFCTKAFNWRFTRHRAKAREFAHNVRKSIARFFGEIKDILLKNKTKTVAKTGGGQLENPTVIESTTSLKDNPMKGKIQNSGFKIKIA